MTATMANYWHPIAIGRDVTDQPQRFALLGTDLVAFRTTGGDVRVFTDLCIHRGVALSLGFIEDDILHCGYHGWAYDDTGKCVHIPSLPPGSSIPSKARAIVHRVVEHYGLVWVALDEPVADVSGFPLGEWDDPEYRTFVSHHYVWKTSAGRSVENFMDLSHFPYVHDGILGSRENTVVAEHEVEDRDGVLYYYYEAPEPSTLHSDADEMVLWEYYLTGPFTIHLCKTVPNGERTLISMASSPTDTALTHMFLWIARNYDHDPEHDQTFIDFTHTIMEQDRLVVESQRPEQIPIDLRDELHLKVPDASGIAYRKLLAEIPDVHAYMP